MQQPIDSPVQAAPLRLQENELRVYARLIWRWLWLIILCTIAGGVSAFVVSRFTAPIYQASTTLLINEARNPSSANYQDILTSERIARTYAQLMTQRPILEQVITQLDLPADIFETEITDVRVTSVRDTQLVQVTVEGTSPQLVTTVANTLPQVFISEIQRIQTARFASSKENLQQQLALLEQQIADTQSAIDEMGQPQSDAENIQLGRMQNALTQYQNSYANLVQSYEALRLTEAQSVDSISVVEPAQLPRAPIRPRTLVNTLLAAIVGGMLALGTIFLIEYLDDRIRSPDELSAVLGAPWLGAISRIPEADNRKGYDSQRLITIHQPRNPISEAFRSLRTNLQFSSVDTGLRSVVVTSANPGEGKTTVAANLAVAMAQAGHRVVLVDADLRRPVQHKIFELRRSPGLTEALLAESEHPQQYLQPGPIPSLRILTSGQSVPNPAELLGSGRMQALLKALHSQADVILFDAPPALAVTDAQVLGRLAQGAVLVVDADKTTRNAALRAADALRQIKVPLWGTVFNRLSRSSRSYYYYTYYYDNDYYSSDEDVGEEMAAMRTPAMRNGSGLKAAEREAVDS